jgi:DNA ligase-1
MKIVTKTSVLESSTKGGEAKYWQGIVLTENGRYYHQSRTWRKTKSGEDSKEVFSEPYEVFPKNVGKKNEVTAETQATIEITALEQKKRDKGYVAPGEENTTLPLPMLANKIEDKKHKIQFPCYVQRKYNGMRMLYDGKKAWSRGGKPINPKCIEHLEFDTDGMILDGELILPGNVPLQTTMSAAKKFKKGVSDTLLYIIYDVIDTKNGFSHRNLNLSTSHFHVLQTHGPNVGLAPTYLVHSMTEINKYHEQFIAEGYEGTIIRMSNMPYDCGHRSDQLIKLKNFRDSEYQIVDVIDGEAKFKGCGIFICKTDTGATFNCSPEGDLETRKEYFTNKKDYIGKWLTVRYSDMSTDGIPIGNPVGVSIRDEEDFS